MSSSRPSSRGPSDRVADAPGAGGLGAGGAGRADRGAGAARDSGGRAAGGTVHVGAGSADPCVESFVRVAQTDPFALAADEQVELLRELDRHAAWLESLRADAMVALAGPGPEYETADPDRSEVSRRHGLAVNDGVRDEIAAALRVSGQAAEFRITVARDLYYKLPQTRVMLARGVASIGQVNAIVRECDRLDVGQARQIEECALFRVASQTPSQTRASVRRAVTRLFPLTPDEDLDAEFARREVTMVADGPVMARVSALLPAPDAIAVWNALTACANQSPPSAGFTTMGVPVRGGAAASASAAVPGESESDGSDEGGADADGSGSGGVDRRTMGHKRADALIAWAQRAAQDPGLPTMQGKKRLETQIVIDAATLLGLADNPGELVGFGPIPATLARRLAADSGTWRRLVTDPVAGHLLDYGTSTYSPSAALREYILARDRTCQFPGCARAAYLCDLDHVQPFTGDVDGGTTSADNLLTLCRRHHRLKTHNNWSLHIHPPQADTDIGLNSDAGTRPEPGAEPAAVPASDHSSDPPEPGVIIEWISPRGTAYRRRRPQALGDGVGDGDAMNWRDQAGLDDDSVTGLELELAAAVAAA